MEPKTVSLPCPHLKVPIGRVWRKRNAVDRCRIGLDNNVMTLPNANKYGITAVGIDGNEVSANNLEPMIVDGEDERGIE